MKASDLNEAMKAADALSEADALLKALQSVEGGEPQAFLTYSRGGWDADTHLPITRAAAIAIVGQEKRLLEEKLARLGVEFDR